MSVLGEVFAILTDNLRVLVGQRHVRIELATDTQLVLRCGRKRTVVDRVRKTVTIGRARPRPVRAFRQVEIGHRPSDEQDIFSVRLVVSTMNSVHVGTTIDSSEASSAGAALATATGLPVIAVP